MNNIIPLPDNETAPVAKTVLDHVARKTGRVPNMYRVMAQSPAVLEAYDVFATTLKKGHIGAKLSEQIAIASAAYNGCNYCLSAHTFGGSKVGLSEEEMLKARSFHASDEKSNAALQFTGKMLEAPQSLSPEDLTALRAQGFTDGEVLEIIANVTRNIFTNFLNVVAATPNDWPALATPLNTTNHEK
ncbi:carboxymuconolactone decarboxylase family protein [Chitinophaga vietnamensis]|uniref:carboxymuconolactone decarboxylase family protein n=1 Tax=Chitinophaga vietnamensis TaxID=2593957 RepID=UPI0011785811|nr:carboxymuconolactone decarboxylase family protein [Chitinophaga vietnamensis]